MVLRCSGRRAVLLGCAGLVAGCNLAKAALPAARVAVEVTQGRCVVPVVLDGRVARMVLDTGAARTVMTRAAVTRLGLRRDVWVDTPMAGAGGQVERRPNADVGCAMLGGAKLFQNMPGGGLSLAVTDLALGGADGLLGGDLLRHFTLELDVAKAALVLWPAGAAVVAGDFLQLQRYGQDLLLAALRLDGQQLTALVDTGASATLINARGLYKLGVSSARAAQDPVVTAAGLGGGFLAHAHRFRRLEFGAITLSEPVLLTAPVRGGGVRRDPGNGCSWTTTVGGFLCVAEAWSGVRWCRCGGCMTGWRRLPAEGDRQLLPANIESGHLQMTAHVRGIDG